MTNKCPFNYDNSAEHHKRKNYKEQEIEIIIKDSLVIIVLGELDDDHLKKALKSYLDTKGVEVAE